MLLYRAGPGGMRSLDPGSTTGAARGTVGEPCELTARRVRPNGPNQSLPHRHIQRKSLYASTGFFVFILHRAGRDEKPRPGFDHWRSQGNSRRAMRADCPKGEAQRAESIPPSPPYSKKKPELILRLFCFYIAPTDGRCASLTCPTKPSVGWVSTSAPTAALVTAARPTSSPARRHAPSRSGYFYKPGSRFACRGCPAAPARWPRGNKPPPNQAPYR